mmetsp:Transcript_57370/g.136414  ORF Transcript_57370/g.136414 Transcript_57370/m.136414 type:complete len:240 (+) Transcript_57370:1208-1927(+)
MRATRPARPSAPPPPTSLRCHCSPGGVARRSPRRPRAGGSSREWWARSRGWLGSARRGRRPPLPTRCPRRRAPLRSRSSRRRTQTTQTRTTIPRRSRTSPSGPLRRTCGDSWTGSTTCRPPPSSESAPRRATSRRCSGRSSSRSAASTTSAPRAPTGEATTGGRRSARSSASSARWSSRWPTRTASRPASSRFHAVNVNACTARVHARCVGSRAAAGTPPPAKHWAGGWRLVLRRGGGV